MALCGRTEQGMAVPVIVMCAEQAGRVSLDSMKEWKREWLSKSDGTALKRDEVVEMKSKILASVLDKKLF